MFAPPVRKSPLPSLKDRELDLKAITDPITDRRLLLAHEVRNSDRELSDLLASGTKWQSEARSHNSDFWVRMRALYDRLKPAPPEWEIATPGGVVDTRTGTIAAHDPAAHDTRALTAGRFRPGDAEGLKELLWQRLRHNMSRPAFEDLLRHLALAVSRKASQERSMAWFYGKSGGGKGLTDNLILLAFGDLAATVSLATFAGTSEIDATLTGLLERDPVWIVCDELNGGKVQESRLLALTGNNPPPPRRSHGQLVHGKLTGVWCFRSTAPPRLSANGGLSRRVAVYGFPREYTGPKDETFSQDELDAVVTLAILGAPACWNPDYRPPTRDTEGEFLNEADPVTAWLETLPESWDRHPVMSTLDAYNASADEPVTIRTFGVRAKLCHKWEVRDTKINGTTRKALRLRTEKVADKPKSCG